jgi:hypothetical protein
MAVVTLIGLEARTNPISHLSRTTLPRGFRPQDQRTQARADLQGATAVVGPETDGALTITGRRAMVGTTQMARVEVDRIAKPLPMSARYSSIVMTAVLSTRMVSRMAPIAL